MIREEGAASLRPLDRGAGSSNEERAAILLDAPTGVEGGKIGSRQGAEFRQGFSTCGMPEVWTSALTGLGSAGFDLLEPQQHEVPRHFEPHLQACAWASASNGSEPEMLDARASPRHAPAANTASKSRMIERTRVPGRSSAHTGNVGAFGSHRSGRVGLSRP